MTELDPRKQLHQILGETVNYILNDCRTIFRVWEEKKEWIDNPEEMMFGCQCGGGQFLVLQGLLSAINLMAKTYTRLQNGERGFKSKKTNGTLTKSIETDETMAFTKLVAALSDQAPLGLNSHDTATIWRTFRHPLAHLGSPQYSVRIGGREIAFEKNQEGQWECTAQALHNCVSLIQIWLRTQIDRQSDESVQDTLDWLLLALDPNAEKVKLKSFEAEEVLNVVDELAFEFFHFRCFRSMRASLPPAQGQAVGYAFLAHLRIIVDFFYMKPLQDDICIKHFEAEFPHFQFETANRNQLSENEAKQLKEALNKRLVHLTGSRWRTKKADWEFYEQYLDRIEGDIKAFEHALPPDLRVAYDRAYSQREKLYRGHEGF